MPERTETLARQAGLYESYLKEAALAEYNRKPGAGIFGLKGGPADDPCHDRFAEALRLFYDELTAQKADSGTVRELMEYACAAPLRFREPRTAYWMLLAVQGLTQPLIGLLSAQDARTLAELYEKSYKRRERLPVQIKLIKALRAAAE